MTLNTALVIAGDAEGAAAALGTVDKGLADTAQQSQRTGAAMEAALSAPLAAIAENTAATAGLIRVMVEASTAAQERARAANAAAQAEREAASVSAQLARAERETATQQAALAAAASNLRSQLDPLYSAQQRFDRELETAERLYSAGIISVREYASAQQLARDNLQAASAALFANSKAANDNAKSANAQFYAIRNVGQQIGDFGLQVASGQDPARAFSQQIGQLGYAASEMGGKLGAVGRFLVGPWGIALTVAAAIAAPFIEKLFQSGDAADEAKQKQLTLAEAFTKSKFGTDEARKAIQDYIAEQEKARQSTAAMIPLTLASAEARLKEALATREQLKANLDKERAGDAAGITLPGAGGIIGNPAVAAAAALADKLRGDNAKKIAEAQQAIRDLRIQDAVRDAKAAVDPIAAINKRYDDMAAAASRAAAGNDKLSLSIGATMTSIERQRKASLDAEREREREARRKPRRGPTAASLEAQAVGFDNQIEAITDQYSNLPTYLKSAAEQLRQLDQIAANINKQPLLPGAADLKRKIAEAGQAIRDNLNKPFNDYLEQQRQAAEIDKLLIQGRDDEAAALQIAFNLQKQMGVLDEQQLEQVLATVEAERRKSEVLRDQRALIQANLDAVYQTRNALVQTVADALRGRFSINNLLSTIGNSAINIASQRIVEKLFGDTLRSLEDQARGENKVDTAAKSIAKSLENGSSSVKSFAEAVDAAAARISGKAPAASAPANDIAANDNPIASSGAGTVVGPDEIKVTAIRHRLSGQTAADQLVNLVDGLVRDLGIKIPIPITAAIKDVLGKLEKSLPQALAGAATGASASRIILGDRGTGGSIGSALGGIAGQALGKSLLTSGLTAISSSLGQFAGPIGAIAGGLLGGVLGGLFQSTPKAKGGAITNVDSPVSVSGNNAGEISDVSSASKAVQSGIQSIAQQLGATIGSFSVSISKYKDSYRVDPNGTGSDGGKYGNLYGVQKFDNNDSAGAIAYAIANAIADGAIQGISPKVKAALQSSTDIDQAVREATKVQQLELALGGVPAQLEKSFRDFEATAADRLKIAQKYGFDIVKVEELNAKERLSLSQQLLKQQVGSLQDLVDQITSGSLYEGSAVDQRKALLDKIAAARADANAGVDGAADKLSQLLEQLNTISKDVYGSTGGFASDQQAILDAAREAIAAANQRVADAQKATDPALAITNQQLDESNDQLAKIASYLGTSVDYLKSIAAGNGGGNLNQLRQAAAY